MITSIVTPFILYAGRKDAGKKVDLLLEYFAEYKKRNENDVKLVLIGGGEIAIPKSVKHEVYDLAFFAEGALTAAAWLVEQPAGLYDMFSMLG